MSKFGITGKTLKEWVEWLKSLDCGCCHKVIGTTDRHEICICVGWHQYDDDGWKVSWKIGQQSFNNGMQCDLDIDFDMPYNPETGDVYDTLSSVPDNPDWSELADEINNTAKEVLAQAKIFDTES
jgi:hypothetical protein